MNTVDPSLFVRSVQTDAMRNASVGQIFVDHYAQPCTPGHFDELRGMAFDAQQSPRSAALAPIWDRFLSQRGANGLEPLSKKQADLN